MLETNVLVSESSRCAAHLSVARKPIHFPALAFRQRSVNGFELIALKFAHSAVVLRSKFSYLKAKSKMKLTPAQIDSIAQDLQCGMCCYVHRKTGEVVVVLSEEGLDATDADLWQEDLDKLAADPENFLEIEPMPSNEAFRVMEDFAETTPRALKARLLMALEKHSPFQHFKHEIDNSGEWRERWFAFHFEKYQDWVSRQL